jgi:hypothetical protein
MRHHHLPLLSSQFFLETPLPSDFYGKWATHYPWSEECLPVAEWDGCLIVACLHPPQDFPSTPRCILVLAHSLDLETAWIALKAPKKQSHNKNQYSEDLLPEGFDLSLTKPSAVPSTNEFSMEDLEKTFAVATTSADLNSSVNEENSIEESPISASTLEGLFQTDEKISLENLQAPPVPSMTQTNVREFRKSESQSNMKLKQAPLIRFNPAANESFRLEKLRLINPQNMIKNLESALMEMKGTFEKSLVFSFNENETQLIVYAWDEKFAEIKEPSLKIALDSPSIFKIVATTQKPYHGYVSLNEVNEKFFEAWNHDHIPDHVTITPIIFHNKLVGLLMGFAEKSKYNRATLNLAEQVSKKLFSDLKAA